MYWVATLNVNSPSEEWLKFHYNPQKYTKSNGEVVEPKSTFDLSFRIKENYCKYNIGEKDMCAFRTCYKLSNPEKVITLEIKDNKGNIKTFTPKISGDVITFRDPDGKGLLTIEYQFVGGSIYNCPSPYNIRLMEYKNNYYLIDKDKYPNNMVLLPTTIFGGLKVENDKRFTSLFTNFEANLNGVKGYVAPSHIGSIVLTVTADQDYFDSVVYRPPTKSKPIIKNINIVDKAQTNSKITMNVEIVNKGEEGDVIVTPSGSYVTFTPSSYRLRLVKNLIVPFAIKVGNVPSKTQICVKACSSAQFGTPNCDTKCTSLNIVRSKTKTPRCGDGICDRYYGETPTKCPEDCGTQIKCPKNSVLQNGECVCISGYKMVYKNGKYECVESGEISTTTLLIIGALLILMVIIITQQQPTQPIKK